MYFQYRYNDKPMYSFGGGGGETLRDYWHMLPAQFIEWQSGLGDEYVIRDVRECAERILSRSFKTIHHYYGITEDDPAATMRLYMESRSRHHFGKAAVENYLANIIKLMPLLDRNLHMLTTDKVDEGDNNFLFLLILNRYADSLLNFKLEGNRSFSLKTLDAARKISEKYPFKRFYNEMSSLKTNIPSSSCGEKMTSNQTVKYEDVHSAILDVFKSNEFKNRFLQVFSDDIYTFAEHFAKTKRFFPLKYIYGVMAADYVISATGDQSKYQSHLLEKDIMIRRRDMSPLRLSYNSRVFEAFLSLFNFARVDIKNMGDAANDMVFENTDNCSIKRPDWFQSDGAGYQIESSSQSLTLKFKCLGYGNLKIWLRGLDVRDGKRHTLPFYVNYTYVSLNKEILLHKATSIWHDKPFVIEKNVVNGEEINLI